jgi:hypothetical protein
MAQFSFAWFMSVPQKKDSGLAQGVNAKHFSPLGHFPSAHGTEHDSDASSKLNPQK